MLNIHGPLSVDDMFDTSNYGSPLVAEKIDVSKVVLSGLDLVNLLNI